MKQTIVHRVITTGPAHPDPDMPNQAATFKDPTVIVQQIPIT